MQSRVLWCVLTQAESALKNFGAALEMWFSDQKRYPPTLQELVPNYLRTLPPGPSGSSQDWLYHSTTDGSSYSVSTQGESFLPLGLVTGLPRFDSKGGLEPQTPRPEGLNYRFKVPPALQSWEEIRTGCYWKRGRQNLYFRLAGPPSLRQSGADWVKEKVSDIACRVSLEFEQAIQMEELSGFELRFTTNDHRVHQFIVSDGELAWDFFYEAPQEEFDEAVDAAFVAMMAERQR